MDKLYFQYRPDNAATEYLLRRQNELSQECPQATQVQAHEFHLSLLHIGKLDRLHDMLVAHNPELLRSDLTVAMQRFTEQIEPLLPTRFLARTVEYQLFGSRGNVVVRIQNDEAIQACQAKLQQSYTSLLQKLGVAEATALVSNHPFTPHITLLRHVHNSDLFQPLEEQEILHLNLVPSRYDLKDGR